MAIINSDDTFLVNRDNTTYSVETQDLMAKLQADDYMVVNRGDVAYKVTGADVIDSLIPPLEMKSVSLSTQEPREDFPIVCTYDFDGGQYPFTATFQWGTYNGTTETDIVDATAAIYTPQEANIGLQLFCKVVLTDNQGTIVTGQSPYTTNTVIKNDIPPILSSVTVEDLNPYSSTRFTNKSFTATAVLSKEGKPLSEKEFVATANGTLLSTVITDPIQTTTTETLSGDWTEGTWITGNKSSPYGSIRQGKEKGSYVCAAGDWRSDDPESVAAMWSDDYGENWYPATTNFPGEYFRATDVAYSPELNRWVLVTEQHKGNLTGHIFISDNDGKSWQWLENSPNNDGAGFPNYEVNFGFVSHGYDASGESLFIAGADRETTTLWSSYDGVLWTQYSFFAGTNPEAFYYGRCGLWSNGRWVVGGGGANNNGRKSVFYSDNGKTWIAGQGDTASGDINTIATNGKGQWVASDGSDGVIVSNDNGVTWTRHSVNGNSINDIDWSDNKYVAVASSGSNADFILWSSDGVNWTAADDVPGTRDDGSKVSWVSVNYLNGKYFFGRPANFSVDNNTTEGVKLTSLTGTGDDEFYTRLNLTGDTNLQYLEGGDEVEGSNSGEQGVIRAVNTTPPYIDLSATSTGWLNGETVRGPVKNVDGSELYLIFNEAGNVTSLSQTPQDPPYLTQDENPELTLVFSQFLDNGNTPDEEMPVGTSLKVAVTATNEVGTSGPISGSVTPAVTGTVEAPQTEAQFNETKLRFLTYENREKCYQGEQAKADRTALTASLVAAGYTTTEIEAILNEEDNSSY